MRRCENKWVCTQLCGHILSQDIPLSCPVFMKGCQILETRALWCGEKFSIWNFIMWLAIYPQMWNLVVLFWPLKWAHVKLIHVDGCCRTLCDIQCNGFLNKEQFALCLWLIEEKSARGKDPPPQLTPEMIPPSMRSNAAADKPVCNIKAQLSLNRCCGYL